MVDTESRVGKILHLSIATRREVSLEALQFPVRVLVGGGVDHVEDAFGGRLLAQHLSGLDRLLASVDEDHALVSRLDELGDLVEGSAVKVPAGLGASGLALDADKVLLERNWSEGGVEEEQACVSIDAACRMTSQGAERVDAQGRAQTRGSLPRRRSSAK